MRPISEPGSERASLSESAGEPEHLLPGTDPGKGPRHRAPARRSRRRLRHPVLTTLAGVAAAMIVAMGLGALWARGQVDPAGRTGRVVAVTIPAGAGVSRIGELLARAGVIHSGGLFPYYVTIVGGGPLLPGTYRLAANSRYSAVVLALEAGPPQIVDRLTVPEGYTLAQIAARVAALPKLHLSAAKFMAAATDGQVRSPYEPAGVDNLEGLVFPATYQVRQGDTEVDVLEQMVGAFDTQAAAVGLAQGAAALHMTPYQVVTVSSIVEREAKLAGDRGAVASVIYNRLRAGMPLGADSTQTYWLRLHDAALIPTTAQLDSPSPYNTRLDRGLPPTPIANPGVPSLQAAVSPPTTSYLYFVETNPDGQLGFASNSAGFARLQAQCSAAKLC